MGAGISQQELNRRIYRKLQTYKRELERSGVAVLYRRRQLYPDVTNITRDIAFNIGFGSPLRASNGECASFACIRVIVDGRNEYYGWQQRDGDFEKGMLRVAQLFGTRS